MNYTIHRRTCGLAVAAAFGSLLPLAAQAAPSVSWGSFSTMSGSYSDSTACQVNGTGIARVDFYLNNTFLNTEYASLWQCKLDTTRFSNGSHSLKAVAYDSRGATTTITRTISIQNGTTTAAPASGAPTVAFQAPASGGALSGNVQGPPHCVVTGSNIRRVMFYLNGVWTNTDGNLDNGLGCWIDTTKYKDGNYTVKAVAYNDAGETASAERAIVIKNTTTSEPAPSTGSGAPSVAFQAPAVGGALSGNVQGPPHCVVTGSNIARVMFYLNGQWTNTDGNLSNGLGCWIDTTKFKDGNYTVKAVAYNAAGQTASAERAIVIKNGTTSNTPPTVSFKAPAAGTTLSGKVNSTGCEASAADSGGSIAKVDFYVGKTLVTTKSASPWQCAIDTTKFANGSHTLMAVATDNQGASATTQRTVSISNTTTSEPAPSPSTGSTIDAADILTWASGNVAFSQQSGYSAQVVGTYTSAGSISEGGIHSSKLSNGETLRLGKEADPANSARKALSFQLGGSDPNTSGSKRSELSFQKTIEMNKVYWVAVRAHLRDWGNESSGGLFGTQMHSGDNSRGLSPSFGIYMSGARNYRIETRYSTSSSPSQSNSVTVKHGDHPIPFGRWADFVFKFKHNTSGQGFLQAWVDGKQIVDYKGNLGFNTPGYKDYAKFGIYNWGSFSTPRKAMLHNPTVVLDPTGSKYSAAALRAHINR